jgi:alpha-amylase
MASLLLLLGCQNNSTTQTTAMNTPFLWEAATVYFLLTDRFNNGDTSNDLNFDRTKETAVLRGFEGGDIKGITQKINEGYFTDLGVNAIWFTPVVEQIHDSTDEGTGNTYAYHGYWAKDWTVLDPNFGTVDDLKELVETAHSKGIRIVLDVVANHTGPVTEKDPVWPSDWVRTGPACDFSSYEGTTACTLVKNLPDVLTENQDQAVDLPQQLLEKWKKEGRYDQEIKELDEFFARTNYTRTPAAYIVKWLTDYVKELGVDGFRVDTVKHASEWVWSVLYDEAQYSFDQWKQNNPEKVLDENPFYMVGEVYGYGISSGRDYSFGDQSVDYFDHGFKSMINFEIKYDAAQRTYEEIFSKYDNLLHSKLSGKSVLNYLSSHDDGDPFDRTRSNGAKAANVLLLTPGAAQIYYGDESNRPLVVDGANGDANLRSFMNWDAIESDSSVQENLTHWQKMGQFRANHPAVGAGRHQQITESPYSFSRILKDDRVVIGLDLDQGSKTLSVGTVFNEGQRLKDAYSGQTVTVTDGAITIDSPYSVVLLHN